MINYIKSETISTHEFFYSKRLYAGYRKETF